MGRFVVRAGVDEWRWPRRGAVTWEDAIWRNSAGEDAAASRPANTGHQLYPLVLHVPGGFGFHTYHGPVHDPERADHVHRAVHGDHCGYAGGVLATDGRAEQRFVRDSRAS